MRQFLLSMSLILGLTLSCGTFYTPSIPMVFRPHKSVPKVAFRAIKAAMADWNEALGEEVFIFKASRTDKYIDPSDFTNVITWDVQAAVDSSTWSGYFEAGLSCDIRLNKDKIFNDPIFYFDNAKSILLHELGHCLGLDHSKDENDIMFKIVPPGKGLSGSDVAKARKQIGIKPGGAGGE